MSGPIVRKYGFPNFEQIFGKREMEHGADEDEAGEQPAGNEAEGGAISSSEENAKAGRRAVAQQEEKVTAGVDVVLRQRPLLGLSVRQVSREDPAELLDHPGLLVADGLGRDSPAGGDLGRGFTLERGVNQGRLARAQ